MPRLLCPYPDALSPYVEEVDAHAEGWARAFGIVTDEESAAWHRRGRFAWLSCRACPTGELVALCDLACWETWLFAFDDRHCEGSGKDTTDLTTRIAGLLRAMHHPDGVPTDDPFYAGFAALWARTTARTTPDQTYRLGRALHGYFLGLAWEVTHRAEAVGLPEYQMMRQMHSGLWPWLTLVEITSGHRLETADLARPEAVELMRRLVNVLAWTNDVLSYPREIRRARTPISLPVVLERARGLDRQAALDEAARLVEAERAAYAEAEAAARPGAGPAMAAFIASLRLVIGGFYAWHVDSGRYN